MPRRHVFVIGLDPFARRKLASIRNADAYAFHMLLAPDTVKGANRYAFSELLAEARATLAQWNGPIDAIVNHWDFPASALHAILCEENDLPGPSLESVLKCDHKYWSRLVQRDVAPECVPAFSAFDPFDEDALETIPLAFPFWIKPVQSYSGYLGFRVEDEAGFHDGVARIRESIHRYMEPLHEVMGRVDLPPEVDAAGAEACIAEALIDGDQFTVEGYVQNGRAHTFGLIDSHRFENRVSFSRYEYPSALPEDVQERVRDVTHRLMEHTGYDDAAFNVEFFHDTATNDLHLLEINSRISQSHSHLFQMVDGASNHEVVVEVALGNTPRMPHREGRFKVAGKMFLRRFEDGVVQHAPAPEEIRTVEEKFPGTVVQIPVEEGMRLSELLDQDSYSHQLAIIYSAANSQDELVEKGARVAEALPFRVAPVDRAPEPAA